MGPNAAPGRNYPPVTPRSSDRVAHYLRALPDQKEDVAAMFREASIVKQASGEVSLVTRIVA